MLYPTDTPESVPAPINGTWECEPCMIALKDRLIAELKENARQRLVDREKKEVERKRVKEEARIKREVDMLQRREAKELEKEQVR